MDRSNNPLQQLMARASHLVRQGQLGEATRAIQTALGGAPRGDVEHATANEAPGTQDANFQPPHAPPAQTTRPQAAGAMWRTGAMPDVEDAIVIERGASGATGTGTHASDSDLGSDRRAPRDASEPGPASTATTGTSGARPGSFARVPFTAPAGLHDRLHQHYHLYVPPGANAGTPMPLVLMLHGCTQNPEDFARGTGMNTAAAAANALVLYPEQPHSANPNGCWNWFRPEDQRRGGGEPALLVAMVRDVMARYPVDTQRVYVAGLSAGGAMAALLGREYPDVFAAVGVHSGLQAGAAHNVMAALSAMKNGAKPNARGTPVAAPGQRVVPVIVFHGDADATVHARNGEQVVAAALGAVVGGAAALDRQTEQGQSAGGQRYTRTRYRLAKGSAQPGTANGAAAEASATAVAEHWVLQGAGHAWAGGHPGGSHTDPRGVNATAEMLRFFLEHRR